MSLALKPRTSRAPGRCVVAEAKMKSAVSLKLSTKAQTLELLAGKLATAQILPLFHFAVREWGPSRVEVLKRLHALSWSAEPLIVRSSAVAEDGAEASFAGHFRSIPHVSGKQDVEAAISSVIESYTGASNPENRVLIQPMLNDVALSGVAFSVDPNTGSDYIVVSYQHGADTTAVTGGGKGALETAYCWKHGPAIESSPLKDVIALVRELETMCGDIPLDIEFAQDRTGRLYLLQLRRLILQSKSRLEPEHQTESLTAIAGKISSANRPHPYLHGKRTIYGVMPDWNPAEMIGVRPRPLEL